MSVRALRAPPKDMSVRVGDLREARSVSELLKWVGIRPDTHHATGYKMVYKRLVFHFKQKHYLYTYSFDSLLVAFKLASVCWFSKLSQLQPTLATVHFMAPEETAMKEDESQCHCVSHEGNMPLQSRD